MKPNIRQKDNLSVENILKLTELYDDNVPRSMEKESKSIPRSSIESRIESLNKVSDTKVPQKNLLR